MSTVAPALEGTGIAAPCAAFAKLLAALTPRAGGRDVNTLASPPGAQLAGQACAQPAEED